MVSLSTVAVLFAIFLGGVTAGGLPCSFQPVSFASSPTVSCQRCLVRPVKATPPDFVLSRVDDNNPGGLLRMAHSSSASAAAAFLMLVLVSPAVASPATDVAQGGEIFVANCASCHAGGMNFIKEKRTLKRDALEKFVGLDQPSVQKFVTESARHKTLVFPRAPGGKLSETDYSDVTSFIVDQAVNDKW